MKFLTFRSNGSPQLGIKWGEEICNLTAIMAFVAGGNHDALPSFATQLLKTLSTPFDCYQLFAWWHTQQKQALQWLPELISFAQSVTGKKREFFVEEKDLEVLSPVFPPRSLRDGYAFRQHVETMRKNRGMEMSPEFDLFPVFYFGNHQSVVGAGEFFVQEKHLEQLDYELEVAVVIGKEGRNIPAAKADDHVFGLCIMNDMSARVLQRDEMKLSLGPAKGKDFGTVLGPYLVTLDELGSKTTKSPKGNSYDLTMKALINGKVLSQGNLSTMNWTFAEIIERASYGVTLYPGDVIGSGTVGTGCLAELNSSRILDNLWLKPGDVVRLEVEMLGALENTIVLANETYKA